MNIFPLEMVLVQNENLSFQKKTIGNYSMRRDKVNQIYCLGTHPRVTHIKYQQNCISVYLIYRTHAEATSRANCIHANKQMCGPS